MTKDDDLNRIGQDFFDIEKKKYSKPACGANGRCGPVCISKRIVRGYRANKSQKEDHERVMNEARRISKDPTTSDDVQHTYKSWVRNKEHDAKNSKRDLKYAASGVLVNDVGLPLATATMTTAGAGIAVASTGLHFGAKSIGKAYSNGAFIDRAMMKDIEGEKKSRK